MIKEIRNWVNYFIYTSKNFMHQCVNYAFVFSVLCIPEFVFKSETTGKNLNIHNDGHRKL